MLLLRHLATSCKWRVSEANGKIFAARRQVDERHDWVNNLNGFISKHNPRLQTRTILGLDAPIYVDTFHAQEFIARQEIIHLPARKPPHESYFCAKFGSHHLEIFEESSAKARTFTNCQLISLKNELEQLKSSKVAVSQGFDLGLMPAFSIGPQTSELRVSETMAGGGTYYVDAFVNPGEFGKTFLKVYEATRNIRLSEGEVSRDSLEYIGWSNDKTQTFFYNSRIMINEGDWESLYPARFELWFRPDNKNKPERKLLERTYSICGWEK